MCDKCSGYDRAYIVVDMRLLKKQFCLQIIDKVSIQYVRNYNYFLDAAK